MARPADSKCTEDYTPGPFHRETELLPTLPSPAMMHSATALDGRTPPHGI